MEPQGLIIDWTLMPTYNTIMSLFVGVALVSLASVGKSLTEKSEPNPKGWALNFGTLGAVLALTGLHMTLTWPLAPYFPFDNIIFGETSLAFGTLLLALSFYFWKSGEHLNHSSNPLRQVAKHLKPFHILLYAMALMLVAIFFAGVIFQLFAAPQAEPITGNFHNIPWLESWVMSLAFLGVGISSFLTAGWLKRAAKSEEFEPNLPDKIGYIFYMATGWFFLLFGALNYYTHIGLIIHTMK